MSQRICDQCGKMKEVKGGRTCETGHFICKEDVWKSAGFFSGPMKHCPVCGKPLR